MLPPSGVNLIAFETRFQNTCCKRSASPNTVTSLSSYAVTKGSIVVNIVDGKTKTTVWQASATHVLKDGPSGNPAKDAERVDKPIRRSVEKMFNKFPRTK